MGVHIFGHLCLGALVHQGIAVQNGILFQNMHCMTIICHRHFKLGESLQKSYGFTFVGPVSMETLLIADSAIFCETHKNAN